MRADRPDGNIPRLGSPSARARSAPSMAADPGGPRAAQGGQAAFGDLPQTQLEHRLGSPRPCACRGATLWVSKLRCNVTRRGARARPSRSQQAPTGRNALNNEVVSTLAARPSARPATAAVADEGARPLIEIDDLHVQFTTSHGTVR